ncbi:MAG TPA: glycosyl hydrolase family 28-related protein [Candidatus Dormibacteraeota bacterium]
MTSDVLPPPPPPPPPSPFPPPSRRRWSWVLGGLLAVAVVAGVLVLVLHGSPSTNTNRRTGSHTPRSTPSSSPEGTLSGLATLPTPAFPPGAPAPPPANAFNVTKYGADPSGQSDATQAIRQAISAAEAAGSGQTVYFPAGTYLLDDNDGLKTDFRLSGPTAPNILGAGRDTTRLVEKIGTVAYPGITKPKTVFDLSAVTGTVFSGLTVDTETFNAGDTIDDSGDNTTIEHAGFLGAQNKNTFTMRVLTVCNANPGHNLYGIHKSGNVVDDVLLRGRGKGGNDDLDFSCQWDGKISNITDVGWGTAVYIDHNVSITNFDFTPGPDETDPRGWYITNSDHISITNFITRGQGGVIKNPNLGSSAITVDHEQMLQPGFVLEVGDVAGMTISNSTIVQLRIDPAVSANGISVVSSKVGSVTCPPGGTISSLSGVTCA